MAKKFYHLVPGPKGGRRVKKNGPTRALSRFDKKEEAVVRDRDAGKKQRNGFVVHKEDGAYYKQKTLTVMIRSSLGTEMEGRLIDECIRLN